MMSIILDYSIIVMRVILGIAVYSILQSTVSINENRPNTLLYVQCTKDYRILSISSNVGHSDTI